MPPDSNEERIVRLLSDGRNRAVLAALNGAARSLSVDELAREIADDEDAGSGSTSPGAETDRIRASLHHNSLPRLEDAGLVEYDREENVVTYRDFSPVDADWLDLEQVDELLARVRAREGFEESAIGVVEGRERVIERGRQLADRAERELFCIYSSTDLLEDECLRHAQDAIDRGVQMYVGSQRREVRDLTRRHLPEATIWEPQLDWMNAPASYPKVGRLVLVDREEVMLAVLDEPGDDGTSPEVALTGVGRENPLVVLVRELLGPRLDHLDYQSEEFRSELPF